MADGSVSTLTNPVTGTGTTNTLPKFTAASTIGNSNITDTGSLITLGSNSTVIGDLIVSKNDRANGALLRITNSFDGSGWIAGDIIGSLEFYSSDASAIGTRGAIKSISEAGANFSSKTGLSFETYSTTLTQKMYLSGDGALGIGSTSLTGVTINAARAITGSTTSFGILQQGQVQSNVTSIVHAYCNYITTQGTAFTLGIYNHYSALAGSIGAGSTVTNQRGFFVESGLTGATNNFGFYGDIPAGTNRWNLYMSGTAANYMAGALGIGSTGLTNITLRLGKTITGSTTSYAIYNAGVVQSDVTGAAWNNISELNTAASAFTLANFYHYGATQGTIGAGSTITTQRGFFANSNLTGATINYGFQGSIPSGTNRWNLYMDGTAANYMAGQLLIGTTSSTFLLDVNGTTRLQGITTISRNDSGSGSSLNIVNTSTTGANNIRIGQDLANNTLGFGYHPSGASTYNSLIPNTAYAFALSGASQLSFNTTTSSQPITFSTNDWNEKMRIFGNGNVNIGGGNTPTDIASAKLAITSTTQGVLLPRMTAAQRTAIGTPAEGLIVVQTDGTQGLYLYIGAAWHAITML
jgi:hypothetical protein